jgi:hypothetical protein
MALLEYYTHRDIYHTNNNEEISNRDREYWTTEKRLL